MNDFQSILRLLIEKDEGEAGAEGEGEEAAAAAGGTPQPTQSMDKATDPEMAFRLYRKEYDGLVGQLNGVVSQHLRRLEDLRTHAMAKLGDVESLEDMKARHAALRPTMQRPDISKIAGRRAAVQQAYTTPPQQQPGTATGGTQ
jgi:hypothetical protein